MSEGKDIKGWKRFNSIDFTAKADAAASKIIKRIVKLV